MRLLIDKLLVWLLLNDLDLLRLQLSHLLHTWLILYDADLTRHHLNLLLPTSLRLHRLLLEHGLILDLDGCILKLLGN